MGLGELRSTTTSGLPCGVPFHRLGPSLSDLETPPRLFLDAADMRFRLVHASTFFPPLSSSPCLDQLDARDIAGSG